MSDELKPCPFCGNESIDLSFARGFVGGDESKPTIAAGCWKCGATGPSIEFESISGYDESLGVWNRRAK